jgi:hypothetical protein
MGFIKGNIDKNFFDSKRFERDSHVHAASIIGCKLRVSESSVHLPTKPYHNEKMLREI